MSWSVNCIGTPDKIIEKLKKDSESYSGQSKLEFDAALPHLIALVSANVNKKYGPPVVQLEGCGHASFIKNEETGQDEYTFANCNVSIKNIASNLCL